MKPIILSAVLSLALPNAALAQAAPDAPTPDASALAPARPPSAIQQLRMSCRADAKAQGLKGPALHDAVDACVIKARPDQAKAIECHKQAKAKGLSGEDMKLYARACRKGLPLPDAPAAPTPAPSAGVGQ